MNDRHRDPVAGVRVAPRRLPARLRGLAVGFAVVALALVALAPKGESQQPVPESSLLLTACQSARALANIAGLNVSRCRQVALVEEGNTALATVKVWVDGQGVFIVSGGYMKTEWSQQSIIVSPVG